jgi:hypothetical protein
MKTGIGLLVILGPCLAVVDGQTAGDFECYVQSAEARMEARKTFLMPGGRSELVPANGPNPHKISGGQLYDFVGTVFIPGGTLERTLRMLQDYDHRPQYFPETISASKLLCRTGDNRFRYTMRLKEPAVIDIESDVTWDRVDAQREKCRSYSTSVHEVGKQHNYLLKLYSYWRFEQVDKGIYVEGETITMSGEFGSLARALGSMVGISPEKSLRHSLDSIRETLLKPGLEFPGPPAALPECGAAFRPSGCAASALFHDVLAEIEGRTN